jgi:geranylgeranyl reductase family protein
MFDVVVIGAGPTGCYAAKGLARLGYKVLVIEEHTEIGEPVHCTGILSLEAYHRFDLDRDCVETNLSSARFFSPGGQSFLVSSDQPQAVVVDRARFDRRLAEQALSLGTSFLLGTRVERMAAQGDRVRVEASAMDEPVSLSSSLAIIATGADDAITRQMGLAKRAPRVSGAQLVAENCDLSEVEVHLGRSIAPGGFAWAVPANGSGCRVGLVCRGCAPPLLDRFATRLERRGSIMRNGARMRCRTMPFGPRTPSFGDRVMVIGDAAGQVKATTGGGIYYGLLGAEAAVDAADRAFRSSDFSARRLGLYESRWLGRIGAEQWTGGMLRKLWGSLSDRDVETLFWLGKRSGVPDMLSGLRFDWHTGGILNILSRDLLGAVQRH